MTDEHTLINHDIQVFRRDRPTPLPLITDAPVRCYRINHEWAKYIIGAVHELINVQAWSNASDERHTAIQAVLQFLEGYTCMDCAEVEDCIETSATIINISTNVSQLETDVSQAQQDVADLEINAEINIYPPSPTFNNADELCAAATYVTDKLQALIHQVVTDAQTITFQEFLENLLPGGGNDVGLLRLLWDYVVANSNPNLLTEVDSSEAEVRQYFYCNLLDRDLTDLDIDASGTITSDAKGAWRGALNATTDGKLALWATIGMAQPVAPDSCNGGDCGVVCREFDLLLEDGGFVLQDLGSNSAEWQVGVGWVSLPINNVVGPDFNELEITKTFTPTVIQSVTLIYSFDHKFTSNPGITIQSYALRRSGNVVAFTNIGYPGNEGDNQTVVIDAGGVECDELRVTMRAWVAPGIPPDSGYAKLHEVTIVC